MIDQLTPHQRPYLSRTSRVYILSGGAWCTDAINISTSKLAGALIDSEFASNGLRLDSFHRSRKSRRESWNALIRVWNYTSMPAASLRPPTHECVYLPPLELMRHPHQPRPRSERGQRTSPEWYMIWDALCYLGFKILYDIMWSYMIREADIDSFIGWYRT